MGGNNSSILVGGKSWRYKPQSDGTPRWALPLNCSETEESFLFGKSTNLRCKTVSKCSLSPIYEIIIGDSEINLTQIKLPWALPLTLTFVLSFLSWPKYHHHLFCTDLEK